MPLPIHHDALAMRHAGAPALQAALTDSRARLLRLLDAFEQVLPPGLDVRYAPEVNPPRWELGHVVWFEEYGLSRNPARLQGERGSRIEARAASLLPSTDALFDPRRSTQPRRWHMDLPDLARCRRYAAQVRERTLALLRPSGPDDDDLYGFRLALFHEDRHVEDLVTMAQWLALDVGDALESRAPAPNTLAGDVDLPARRIAIGRPAGGFAFDDERGAHEVELDGCRIDGAPVDWARFMPFVEDGGYEQRSCWSEAGWAWRQQHSNGRPHYLNRDDGPWQRAEFAHWRPLDPAQPACNLSLHEAEAWCRWAGRRLPSEFEWEAAALTLGDGFEWGQVWEWTSSPYAPYPGFEAGADRDPSQPAFDGRPVLRGGSFATAARLRHPCLRQPLAAQRSDRFAGFRSCAAT